MAAVASPAVFRAPGVHRLVLKSGDQVVHAYPFGVFKKSEGDEVDGND